MGAPGAASGELTVTVAVAGVRSVGIEGETETVATGIGWPSEIAAEVLTVL